MRETNPRFSIVTPSYSQAAFIEKTIRSIVEQKHSSLQYIIIDGGSNDGTWDIIQKYRHLLDEVVREGDTGQSQAINKGFDRCVGDIITFCNSDDYYLPGAFEKVDSAFSKNQSCGAVVGAVEILEEGQIQPASRIVPFIGKATPCDFTLGPPGVYRLHQAATFYSSGALEEVGAYVREDLSYVMDRELLYRVARRFPICTLGEPLAVFRRHGASKSSAQILPFAREFHKLYIESVTGNRREDRRRRRMAAYHLGRGYMKHAIASKTSHERARAIIRAVAAYPRFAVQPGYYRFLLRLLP